MLVTIKELSKRGSIRLKGSLDMSDLLKDRPDIADFGQLEAHLEASFHSGIITVQGQLSLPLKLICSRCLGAFDDQLQVPFRETFTQNAAAVPKDEEDETHIVTTDQIDLKPYVEEAVWLALPYIPLCSEQCEGLCPVCGQNRNESKCECRTDRIDPRLAGLADFFKE